MDLRAWLLEQHDDLRDKLRGSVIDLVPPERWTEQVDGGGSSVAWLLLHLARHQDLAVTTAVRDQPPRFLAARPALGLDGAPPWAGLTEREDPAVAAAPTPEALAAFVDEVFDSSRGWLEVVGAMALDTTPDTARRLERRAELPEAEVPWLYRMWSGRPVRWFVQWPLLGHGHAHVGEAISVRNRMGLSPF